MSDYNKYNLSELKVKSDVNACDTFFMRNNLFAVKKQSITIIVVILPSSRSESLLIHYKTMTGISVSRMKCELVV